MSLDFLKEKGVPLDRQVFTWREFGGRPYSKLDDDAFARIRVILASAVEAEAVRFSHACAQMNRDLRVPLGRVRRIEHHQQTFVTWLHPGDQSPLEATIAHEQAAIEVTAWVAQQEPDPYLAQAYRFGVIENLDHLYRFSGLMDRLSGKDANNILQSYTDVRPGRPTIAQHRAPDDDQRIQYDGRSASPLTKLNALTILSVAHQVRDYYMTVGPLLADPIARMLYAEIVSIAEQHVTQAASLIDPDETWLEKWLLHECNEVYTYWSCLAQEHNPWLKAVWDRFLSYELGQLHFVMDLMRRVEKRDPVALLPEMLPEPIKFESQRDFVRKVLANEVDLRANGPDFVRRDQENDASARYRTQLNSDVSPSELVTTNYQYTPGTELNRAASDAVH